MVKWFLLFAFVCAVLDLVVVYKQDGVLFLGEIILRAFFSWLCFPLLLLSKSFDIVVFRRGIVPK